MGEIVLDAFLDTVKLFPFLLLIYILIEILEHRTSLTQNRKILQGELAPVIGSATGIIPQCGFSVMAAKLYDSGFIRVGTLLAVFIATSDEALIIMLSDLNSAGAVMPLVLIKLVAAVGVGYLANLIIPQEKLTEPGLLPDACACGNEHKNHSDLHVYLVSPLLHSLKIALYLLIINLVFGCIIDAVGEEAITSTLIGGAYVQPLITALIGLIPNCASSVILTGSYINGGLLFGSLVGGLCANAGLGLMVLFRNTKKIKRNILFTITLYAVGVVVGIAVNGVMSIAGMF